MPRAKRGFKARRRRNRVRAEAKGYRGGRSKLWKAMLDTVHHAWRYATRHRRQRKRDWRGLWIIRINAAARQLGVSYSKLMGGLKRANVALRSNAHATGIVFDGLRATGVRYRRGGANGRSETVRARREVIVCAGAVTTL